MTIKVFVSSTRKDLDADCRPEVLEAFRFAPQGLDAINMEDWSTEYRPAVEICRDMVEDSTHYLGVFGYYRGWVPDGGSTSITEMELTWARAKNKPVAIFLPNTTRPRRKPFARVLEQRALAEQSPADLEAQRTFLQRVGAGGGVEFFENPRELAFRTMRRLHLWANPPAEAPAVPPSAGIRKPVERDLPRLGRLPQASAFESALQGLGAPGVQAACFLVHGPIAFGQDKLVSRLRTIIEADAPLQPRHCMAGFTLWRQSGLESVLNAIAHETGGPDPATVQEVAERLARLLAVSDVILEVPRVRQYLGGAAGFMSEFWQPLVAALPTDLPYRMLCLVTHEGEISIADVQPYVQQAAQPLDPSRLVVLPELTAFTPHEVVRFVRSYLSPESVVHVGEIAKSLVENSNGGIPQLLYNLLLDGSSWL